MQAAAGRGAPAATCHGPLPSGRGSEVSRRVTFALRVTLSRRVAPARCGTLAIALLALTTLGQTQNTLRLTLKEAEKTALQNNPQIAASRFTAEAAAQIPAEGGSAFQPTLFGSITAVGAD